jgi:phosphoribosylformylglycinamidine synthase PurS subunit
MIKAKVYVTLRENILDPQGVAVKGAIESLGYNSVQEVRIGKYIELQLDEAPENVEATLKDICTKLLANVVMEDFRYEVETV